MSPLVLLSLLSSASGLAMPQLRLAHLVEEVEYERPVLQAATELQHPRARREEQGSAVLAEAGPADTAEEEPAADSLEACIAKSSSSPVIARILCIANAEPQEIDEDSRSYSGRRRRAAEDGGAETGCSYPNCSGCLTPAETVLCAANAEPTPLCTGTQCGPSYGRRRRRAAQAEPPHSNAHQYGLQEPRVHLVKVKSHGNFGKVVQEAPAAGATHVSHSRIERRKRSDNFIPFNVYDERRVKLLRVEENGFHALPRRNQLESRREQEEERSRAREGRALHLATLQLTAAQ